MKFLSVSFLAVAVASSAVYAELDVEVHGEVKFLFADIDNNVIFAPGLVPSSKTFSTSADVDVTARGSMDSLTYGADVELDLDADAKTVAIEKSEIWVITSFGRFGAGKVPTSNRSADVIAAGEGGVSTDPIGREYEDKFGGTAFSYGLQLGGFAAGVSVNDAFEPSWTVLYGGETLNGGSYEVYTRGTDRGDVNLDNPIGAGQVRGATSYKAMQHGAKVSFGDIALAGSFGKDKATDYGFLNGFNAAAATAFANDNIERDFWNVAAKYSAGGISVSVDYDKGTVKAPWATALGSSTTAAPTTTSTIASVGPNPGAQTAISDADYSAWSVGMDYKIADGLVFGAGYKEYNKRIDLLLEATGAATGGFKMKDQSELRASLTLTF